MFACSRLLFSLIGLAWMLFCVPCLADDADTELSKTFAADVQPLLAKHCVRCHNGDEMKSGIRVDQLDATLQDRHLFLWRDIKKQLDDHAMPPEDETQPTPEERERFSKWIEHAMNVAKSRNTQKNGSIRRLTVSQYRNTMRTLLGLNENLSEILPPDGISKEGFANNGQVLGLSPLQMEYYFEIAEKSLDLCIVDEDSPPTIQNFRMDLGRNINADPCKDSLVLGANSLLLANSDFVVTELAPKKSFAFTPFEMKKSFDFIEGYVGNDTIRQWKHFDTIYHAVFACMRGTEGYPLGEPYQTVQNGLLLRPAIPSPEIFGESNTYGPMANFKISLRELPDHGDFNVTVKASRYDDGLLLENATPTNATAETSDVRIGTMDDAHSAAIRIETAGIYQLDVSCVMSEPAHLLRLSVGDREFSRQIASQHPKDASADVAAKEQYHAILLLRLPAGDLTLSASHSDKTAVRRMILSRLNEDSPDAQKFLAFERRSPLLGVHLGLRRDCGSTLSPVQKPIAIANHEPQEFVFTGSINDYPYPAVEKDNVNYLAGIREIGVRSEYTDGRPLPRLMIHSVEFEGPYYESWPPETHRRIFIESPHQNDPPAYAKEILQSFATRAWRRPVTDAELNSLLAVWKISFDELSAQSALRRAGDVSPLIEPSANHQGIDIPRSPDTRTKIFQRSIRDALLVVLTSPQFLFLIESSETPDAETLNDWELASKLSYFLWNEPPDDELLKAAADGTLKAQLTEQTNRLLRDPRSHQFVSEFASQWLSLDKFDVLEIDRTRYPHLTRDARAQLREEPIEFLNYLIQDNRPAADLVSSEIIVANDSTAKYYGLADRVETGFAFVPVKHESQQLGGVLTHAGILAGLSDGRESNPIKRGAWVARRIIAEPPEDPPPNVPQLKEDGEKRTLREKLERHRNQPGCAKCHSGIDPWGVAFEEYDASGRFKKEPTDARSTLPDGTEVADLTSLKHYLANDRIDQVAFSVMKHLTCYASGRSMTYNELEWLREEGKQLKTNGYRLQDMIHFIVQSDLFLKK